MTNIAKLTFLARKFSLIMKRAQTTSVQAGEIADDFPQYFPGSSGAGSPLMTKLDTFLSNLLPADVNATITFLVQPGFALNFGISMTKNGAPLENMQWITKIKNFLLTEMKAFTPSAKAKYGSRDVAEVLTVATHTI